MVIDGHVHLWAEAWGYEVWIRRKIAGIDRDFTVADLRAASRVADADGAILGHATGPDVTAPDPARRLDAWQRHPKFRGLRVMPAFGGDAGWLARPDVR